MRRHLVILSLAGLLGLVLMAGDASACHKRKACAPAPCAPAPCVVVAQPCPPPPCPPPTCGHCGRARGRRLFGHLGCHKKRATCPPPVVCAAPVYYTGPSPQALPAPQS